VQRLVVVVTGVETGQTLERWVFAVQAFAEGENAENAAPEAKTAAVKEITKQIQAIIRQITASVTFLPLLEEACAFDLLVYARKKADVPGTWEDSDPKYITNAQEVKLRSFTTSIHQVEAAVSYKADDV
jgi:mitotic spindle assembly checkpoint protein MAD2|tara:strand:+ start:258 stop:644 length:387 start_codon:yes stop_codon:yes gene_type:complete